MDTLERREIARVIGRIITLLINKGIITREEALWATKTKAETKTEELLNEINN